MRNVGFLKMRGSPSDTGFSYGNWSKAILVLQRITKPLLYQLSYVGAGAGKDYIRRSEQQARSNVRRRARVRARHGTSPSDPPRDGFVRPANWRTGRALSRPTN
jgi:hypothetical protein